MYRYDFLMLTLDASLYLLDLVLICISKFSFSERIEALLKETIAAALESASRVCTFKTDEAVKMELIKDLNMFLEGCYVTLKDWFFNMFGKSFGAYVHQQWDIHP